MMMNPTYLKLSDCEKEAAPADCNPESAFSLPTSVNEHCSHADAKILRFAKSERMLHWCIAAPFLISFGTGVLLAIIYNPDPSRPWRSVFAAIHRVSGLALGIFPMVALLNNRHDVWIHLYNIKQAWIWVYDDFKWLALMGLAAISSRFELPEQGKFNAAEKLNFMVLMSTYPLYVATGLLMWLTHLAVLSWILHCLMAMLATPLILGHLYMALINADTRAGLEGMISGHVDREWAKHHYRRWYRRHHEATEAPLPAQPLFIKPAGSEYVDIASRFCGQSRKKSVANQ
jgi:formate dehydrogenase subunit gamma